MTLRFILGFVIGLLIGASVALALANSGSAASGRDHAPDHTL